METFKFDYDSAINSGNPHEADVSETTEPCEKCKRPLKVVYYETGKIVTDEDTGERSPVTEIDLEQSEHCEFHLRVVCSWCKKPQGLQACDEQDDGKITHSMCRDCGIKWNEAAMDIL